jgi:hypothetical protein
VIEYNAMLSPDEDKIVKYKPNGAWDGSDYFGASILSLFKLGRDKEYSLVYIDRDNLFFIHDSCEPGKYFINSNEPPASILNYQHSDRDFVSYERYKKERFE